jgi:hypothetical protein
MNRARSLLVAGLQGALLLSVAGWFLLDRATLPRGWGRTEPVDPDLPIRGRYLNLQLVVPAAGLPSKDIEVVQLQVRQGGLLAVEPPGQPGASTTGRRQTQPARIERRGERSVAVLLQPLAFFLPEHAVDPSRRPAGEELWVEVSLPPQGPPRPIRLGLRQGEQFIPLPLR